MSTKDLSWTSWTSARPIHLPSSPPNQYLEYLKSLILMRLRGYKAFSQPSNVLSLQLFNANTTGLSKRQDIYKTWYSDIYLPSLTPRLQETLFFKLYSFCQFTFVFMSSIHDYHFRKEIFQQLHSYFVGAL